MLASLLTVYLESNKNIFKVFYKSDFALVGSRTPISRSMFLDHMLDEKATLSIIDSQCYGMKQNLYLR